MSAICPVRYSRTTWARHRTCAEIIIAPTTATGTATANRRLPRPVILGLRASRIEEWQHHRALALAPPVNVYCVRARQIRPRAVPRLHILRQTGTADRRRATRRGEQRKGP